MHVQYISVYNRYLYSVQLCTVCVNGYYVLKKISTSSDSKTIEDLRDQLSTKSKQYDELQKDMIKCKQEIAELKDQNKALQDKVRIYCNLKI